MSTLTKVGLFSAIALIVVVLAVPASQRGLGRLLRLVLDPNPISRSETVVVKTDSGDGEAEESLQDQELKIVTLLGFDAIEAILNPDFVTAREAEDWMSSDEQVLGLSINGDHRAYSVPMLSRHEIVNDVVGGVPVAITW